MEGLEMLYDKDDKKAYHALLELEVRSAESDTLYSHIVQFLEMLAHEKSFVRVRGFRLVCAQARWDHKRVIEAHLDTLLAELEDDKSTAVRQCLAALHGLVLFLPELSQAIACKLRTLDCSKYSDSMRPLIEKDMKALFAQLEI